MNFLNGEMLENYNWRIFLKIRNAFSIFWMMIELFMNSILKEMKIHILNYLKNKWHFNEYRFLSILIFDDYQERPDGQITVLRNGNCF